ncbi:MAG TPA: hypothetical protein H9871_02875, partial [Candidatus Nesterenkonia stercoripullorum]|nr:hypothetical protein [Candidatus Nesterenkonia stercoripullorum]
MGNAEFDRGTALIEEASKRYETAESRIAIAKNALVDMGISIGGSVLPVLANLADGAADVAGWFADLPGPMHEAAAGLGAVVGTGALAAGTFLMLAPRVADTWDAFKRLNSSTGGTAATIGKVGLAVGVAAAAMPLLISGARAVEDSLKGIDREALNVGMEEMASRTLQAADATSAYDALLGDLAESGALNTEQFDSLGTAVQKIADQDAIGKFGVRAGFAAGGMDLLIDRLSSTGEALGLLYQTDLPRAQESFAAIWAEAQAGGATFDQLLEVMPAFKDELQAMANMMGVDATDSAILFKIATGELTPVVDETTGAVTGFTEGMEGAAEATQSAADAASEALKAIQDLANEFIAAERGALDYKDAMSDVDEAIKENGRAWENGTEAADENKRALLDLAEQALATAASFDSKHESGTFLAQAREDLIDTAMQMGATREEAERYVDQLGLTPEKVTTQIELDTDAALEKWNGIWDELGYHPPQVPVDADTDPAKETIDGLVMSDQPPANVPVEADTAPAEEEVHVFGSRIGDMPTSDIPVNANVEPAQWEVNLLQAAINDAGGTVDINGNTVPGDQALATLMGIINSSDGTVTIDGMPVPAEQALGVVIGKINAGEGTVDIEGDPSGANAATDSAKRKADGTTGTIGVDANTGRAESDINRTARDRSSTVSASAATGSAESTLNRLARRRTAVISVSVSGGGSLRGTSMGRSMRAGGGPVFGPGTEVSDSIPAQLSHNEHVWAAREVRAVGGHAKLHNIRSQVLAGAKTIHLAEGGAADGSVGAARYVPDMAPVQAQSMSSPIDYSAMGAHMRAAVSGMTVALNLDGRTLYGAVVDAGKAQRAPFVTRRS